MTASAFWKTKKLTELDCAEWESLCDGCGKCCLNKLEDEDTGEIAFTNVVCDRIDLTTCRCTCYENRTRLVPNCVDIKTEAFVQYDWLPPSCAYRLVAEGRDLPAWHPLISGRPESVHEAGASIRSYAITESDASDLVNHIIDWIN
ncbi:MAG: YcgN family cysteine cluster protein [Gammaproteobacteria bacterium]